jgi:hypothetical protein
MTSHTIDDDTPPPATPNTATHEMAPGDSGPTRVTVNLSPQAIHALDAVVATTGRTRTAEINRAIVINELVQQLLDRGNGCIVVIHPDGERERITIP